jgi:two-component system nitrogen regulation sensor histidine kinase NtrY
MAFKHFRIQVIARVVFLFLTMVVFGYVVTETSLVATAVLLGALVIYQVWGLVGFVERTNRQLTRFLEAIRHQDFSQTFVTSGLGRSFEGLASAFSQVTGDFRRARAEKEVHYRYLQTLVEHIGVGIISFRDDGDVELINHAAKRILGINYLRNINRLAELTPLLPETLKSLDAGQRVLVKVSGDYDTLQLAVHAAKIRRGTEALTLVSIQNIGSELAEQEMVAWQTLIRVLTHEIMNSVTPIASLAGSIKDLVNNEIASPLIRSEGTVNMEVIEDLSGALTTIEKRSQGLLQFVEAYRNLTKIPRPDYRIVVAGEMVSRLQRLLGEQISAENITLTTKVEPPDLELAIDPNLIEQVLINLVMNSFQALKGHHDGAITVHARIGRGGKTLIEVTDNGPGIDKGALEKVFIPFYTTKKNGTGIGLALARQIMLQHGGNITVRSTPHERTCFTLSL